MRIDLHIHTKGEKLREISNDNLIKTLDSCDVRFASVTEHNIFDEDQFKFLLSNDKNIVFIPGMEVDVKINERQYHIIVISNDIETVKKFENQNFLKWEDFQNIALKIDQLTLLSFHFMKHENRSFQDRVEVSELVNKIKTNTNLKFMLDLPSSKKVFDVSNHINREFHTAAFSDVSDWNEYSNKSNDLPSTNKNINSLLKYVDYFVEKKYQFGVDNPSEPMEYKYFNKLSNKEESIKITQGLNIIFGEKGSGKSKTLDFFAEKNSEFTYIKFEDPSTENLNDLYKAFIADKLIPENTIKNIEDIASDFNKPLITEEIIFNNKINDIQKYIEHLNASQQSEFLNKLKDFDYFKKTHQDIEGQQKKIIEIFKKINDGLLKIKENINETGYIGSISEIEIETLAQKNIVDYRNAIKLNHHKMKENWNIKISKVFKLASKKSLELNKLIISMIENVEYKSKVKDTFLKYDAKIGEKKMLFKSNVLGSEYVFDAELVKRKNQVASKNDSSLIKSPENTNISNNLIDKLKSKFKLTDILRIKIEKEHLPISLKDSYNLFFNSNFEKGDQYLPSTGQYDMLKLDDKLSKDKDLIIDEFCNSLDNEYIYKNLISKLNEYKGKIIASTHNPLVSVLPIIGTYTYKTKHGGEYLTYQSNDSIFDKLINVDNDADSLNAREQLLKTIEGTEDAFKKRKDTYEL